MSAGITWEEIEKRWLGESRISLSSEAILSAFQTVEQALGSDYLEFRLAHGGSTGSIPTYGIVDLGQQLAALNKCKNSSSLLSKLRSGELSAFAELTAMHILDDAFAQFEYEPEVRVKERIRKPDFRLKSNDSEWLYVEVARADISEMQTHMASLREPFFALIEIMKEFALEVYLTREPTDTELKDLVSHARKLCLGEAAQIEKISDVGYIKIEHVVPLPPTIIPTTFPDEPIRPMLGKASIKGGGPEPVRLVSVRIAYSDERAEEFLRGEAKQLPTDAPGLIMFDVTRAPSGPKTWTPLLRRRLQPNINTRVSGICMFHAGHEPPEGAIIHRSTLLKNPHSHLELPDWIDSAIARYPEWQAPETKQGK